MNLNMRPTLSQRLVGLRRLARWVLLFERVWPALWPAVAILGALACAALLGVIARLPPMLHMFVVLLALGTAAVLGWWRLRLLAWPDDAAADRRLEQASRLRHQPLRVLSDTPAAGTGEFALWRAHVARVEASLGKLRVGLPRPGLAIRDGRALRHLLVLGLVAALVVAGADAPRRLLGIADPGFPPPPPPVPVKLQAWITPPAYTSIAPLLLNATDPEVTVPAGSKLTASLSGGAGLPEMRLDGAGVPFQPLDANAWQASIDLRRGGTLTVRKGSVSIGVWDLTVIADVPPVVRWPASPEGLRGRIPQTRLPWQVEHPYGVAELHAELRLQARPDARPVMIDVPLPSGAPRTAKGARQVDLTPNPWAGLPVTGKLSARDTGGLTGESEERGFTLPERRFQHPGAQVIVAARKQLALTPDDRALPLAELERLAGDDATWSTDPGGYLNLRFAIIQLEHAPDGDDGTPVIDGVQDRLWQLALHLEEQSSARTAQALEQARKALRAAMDRAHRDAGKTGQDAKAGKDTAARQQELQKLERELKQALENHLQAMRRDARRDAETPQPPEALGQQAMQALQQLKDATDANQAGAEEQREADLEQALDQLEQARRDANRSPRERKRAEGRQRGHRQMGVLQDLVKRETGLVDHARSRAQGQADPSQNLDQSLLGLTNPPADPADPGAGLPPPADSPLAKADQAQRRTDDRVQNALRRALGVLMQQFGDLTGKVPTFLGDADQAMHDAQAALRGQQDDKAADAAQRAVAALEQGGRSMSQELARQFGRQRGQQQGDADQQGDNPDQGDEGDAASNGQAPGPGDGTVGDQGDSEGGRNVDPFGRALREGEAGATDSGDTAVPETMEQARTRAVQEELRRRGAERTRPRQELDYIGRLLDQP